MSENFFDVLDKQIHQHPFLHSRLVTSMASGVALTREQAGCFARLYYPHILRTRLYQANALGIAEDEEVQFILAEILHDEYGKGDREHTHMAVYRKFLRALNIPEAQIQSGGEIIPELALYIDSMMRLTQQGHWLEAAAAVGIASEWPIPALYRQLLRGLRTVPGLDDEALELFIGHIELDIEHSRMMRDALRPYILSEENRTHIVNGVLHNLNARLVFYDGLYSRMYENRTLLDKAANN